MWNYFNSRDLFLVDVHTCFLHSNKTHTILVMSYYISVVLQNNKHLQYINEIEKLYNDMWKVHWPESQIFKIEFACTIFYSTPKS